MRKESMVPLTTGGVPGAAGSGADNFFDAGSCIDGRLTSAWNWCSKLEVRANALEPGWSKRAGASPVDAVVRETVMERQVHFQSSD